MENRFKVGDRVQLSEEAIRRDIHPRAPRTRQGYVRIVSMNPAAGEIAWVRWDGRQSDEAMHPIYLDLVERPR